MLSSLKFVGAMITSMLGEPSLITELLDSVFPNQINEIEVIDRDESKKTMVKNEEFIVEKKDITSNLETSLIGKEGIIKRGSKNKLNQLLNSENSVTNLYDGKYKKEMDGDIINNDLEDNDVYNSDLNVSSLNS